MQTKFISGKFSWKTTGLAKVGVKGIGQASKSIRSFVLRTYIVSRMGMRDLYISCW